jgi:hypothetical protein
MTQKTKLRGLSLRANYTDRRLSAKLVPTFAYRGCYVVSVTDPYGRINDFLDRTHDTKQFKMALKGLLYLHSFYLLDEYFKYNTN